jgi:hypothetical protein
MIWGDEEIALWGGRNDELAPETVDVFLGVVQPSVLHHVEAGCAVGSICANEKVEGDFDFGESLPHCFCTGVVCSASLKFEPGGVFVEIGTGKLV